jgi:hypothetical protein
LHVLSPVNLKCLIVGLPTGWKNCTLQTGAPHDDRAVRAVHEKATITRLCRQFGVTTLCHYPILFWADWRESVDFFRSLLRQRPDEMVSVTHHVWTVEELVGLLEA